MRIQNTVLIAALTAISLLGLSSAHAGTVVIGHPDTPALTEDLLHKVYLGKIVEINGKAVIPVNLSKGNALRKSFFEQYLAQDEDKYTSYWTVRRYIGKGSPPREFATDKEVIEFVRNTPGAIGYLDDGADLKQVRTLLKKP